MDDRIPFEAYWKAMSPLPMYENRKTAAELEWNAHPEKHKPIMTWLRKHGAYPERNPYFFIHDFTVVTPTREPTNMNGRTLKSDVQYVTAKYNGSWGTYSMDDVRQFNLETFNIKH